MGCPDDHLPARAAMPASPQRRTTSRRLITRGPHGHRRSLRWRITTSTGRGSSTPTSPARDAADETTSTRAHQRARRRPLQRAGTTARQAASRDTRGCSVMSKPRVARSLVRRARSGQIRHRARVTPQIEFVDQASAASGNEGSSSGFIMAPADPDLAALDHTPDSAFTDLPGY
jgi:hypothetical protein